VQAVNVIPISIAMTLWITAAFGQALCDPKDFPMQPPVEVMQVRGVVVDATGAVIRDVRVEIRKQTGKESKKIDSLQTNEAGRLESRHLATGAYHLDVMGPRGFCRIVIPIKISETGWRGFRLTLPISATDTCPSYCQNRYRLEKAEE
jgi:hypothetical protein